MLSDRLNLMRAGNSSATAVFGFAVWVVWLIVTQPDRTAGLLMLSPFVLVPLVFGLIEQATTGEQPLLRQLTVASVPLALVAAISFSFDQGVLAAALALPWFAFTGAAATEGVLRLLGRRQLWTADLGFDLALILVSVGGAWLVISRFGATFGFTEFIVELTAVHFHYAGFALPAVAGALARHRHGATTQGAVLPIAVLIGVVATAIGITVGGVTEWLGATAMALVGFVVAAELLRLGRRQTGLGRGLLIIAGCALGGGMVMALIWAWTVFFGVTGPGLDLMVATHGGLNALGFGLVGLIGMRMVPFTETTERRSLRLGRPTANELQALAANAEPIPARELAELTNLLHGELPEGWRRDDFELVGPASFDAAKTAIVEWAGHRAAGITLENPPAIAVGNFVALAIPVLGVASTTARSVITDVVDEPDRFGFTYAATDHHPMDGVEAFVIEPNGDGVRLTIPVVWRPVIKGAQLLPPLTRWLQRRALARYMIGITTSGEVSRPSSAVLAGD